MTREDIIRMARNCGINFHQAGWPELERFAALVAAAAIKDAPDYKMGYADGVAAENEACAKVADSISEDQWALYKGLPPYTGKELERASDYTQGKSDGAEVCAVAIRARVQA